MVCERVITRLIVDEGARQHHIARLKKDGDRHNDLERETFLAIDDELFLGSLPSQLPDKRDILAPVCLVLIMSDATALLRIAAWVQQDPMDFWKQALAAPREPFASGDRDDRAAARLYELAKLYSGFVGR